MAGTDETVGGLAGRYALALYELADQNKQLDAVASDLTSLQSLIAESGDLRSLIRSPVYGRDQQAEAIAAILERAGASDLVRRFVGVVAENGRLFALPRMIQGFIAELRRRRGEVTAKVISARALSETQRNALAETLQKKIGGKVEIDTQIDPSLLGGLIVQVGSRMVDGSLKSKLERLKFAMKGVG
ncbi:F0F1 ATP synthase subunit delta [Algihabitans albus]|uniref:F0F1 ATP synthase subunit delta n=1 Tax=Algihabitans albus TaxID=2164067 RepID=UPI000E5C9708|nr:F0F1 ATP synthase subunit delta [Algihabitans albus]